MTHKKEVFLLEASIQTKIGDCHLSKMSFPVAIKTHANQNHDVWAAVIWDNAYCTQPYQLRPVEGNWILLRDAMDRYFMQEIGRHLSEINLKYLFEKCCKAAYNFETMQTTIVTISKFCIEKAKNCDFTFFEFFYDAIRLIKECLLELWLNDYVIGFVSKIESETILSTFCSGTFLLRFSESETGAVTMAYKTDRGVKHIRPKTKEDLSGKEKDVVKRILDLKELKYLYPNIEKSKLEEMKSEKHKTKSKSKPGYVDDETRFELKDDT